LADFLLWVDQLPRGLVYLLLGMGAALENVIPAIPADTFVALGGFLSAIGQLDWRWLLAVTWLMNVTSALGMYRIGYTHGRRFFERGWGRRVLNPRQMDRMSAFYGRFGLFAIFFTRFLPGLRAVVPIFAGVSHQPLLFVAIPIGAASAIWYGLLIWMGAVVGQNLSALQEMLRRSNGVLLMVALITTVAVGAWWWRTRHPPHE
jgi:membrane protein DedA with SNARE-associated domain